MNKKGKISCNVWKRKDERMLFGHWELEQIVSICKMIFVNIGFFIRR